MRQYALIAFVFAAACGDDGMTVMADAKLIDATAGKVVAVTCPASPAATVTTSNTVDAYSPMSTTIPAGGIVRFVMSSGHDVAPNPITTTDPALVVGFGQTKCLQFNQAGTYGFFCSAHSFAGTVTVQ